MTKVFVINGSPNMEKGNTHTLLAPFIQGMTDAGAEIELTYASRLNLKPCTCGRMYCWYQKPGECCIEDEMQRLYPKLRTSDILVLATPVYIPLPSRMQDFINRMCPLIEPFLEYREGRTRAKFHDSVKIKKIVLVATGDWWEKENFDTVVRIVRDLSETVGAEFSGAVVRPHALLMYDKEGLTSAGQSILEEARNAGYQMVKEGFITPETLEAIRRPLVTESVLRAQYNDVVEQLKKTL
jgi:multimeric flavodoxin WrbA